MELSEQELQKEVERLRRRVIELEEELAEAEDWSYSHGSRCDCIACRVPG